MVMLKRKPMSDMQRARALKHAIEEMKERPGQNPAVIKQYREHLAKVNQDLAEEQKRRMAFRQSNQPKLQATPVMMSSEARRKARARKSGLFSANWLPKAREGVWRI